MKFSILTSLASLFILFLAAYAQGPSISVPTGAGTPVLTTTDTDTLPYTYVHHIVELNLGLTFTCWDTTHQRNRYEYGYRDGYGH